MRKLASIQKIISLSPIPNADKIEKAIVLGWEVVVAKSENFKVGDLVVYIEIDSIVPPKPEFEFLRERKFRIKTIKLKGQVSQGLIVPLSVLPKGNYVEGQDVTEILGVKKYDPEGQKEQKLLDEKIARSNNKVNKFLSRYPWYRRILTLFMPKKASWPKFIKKTDEDRIQLFPHICENEKDTVFSVTEKLDGNRIVVIKGDGVVKSFTRQGNQYEGLEEIESDIINLPLDNVVFDGELIADTQGSTHEIYTETTSKARKKGSNKTGLLFHIFDILPLEEFQKGQSKDKCIDRKHKLSCLFANYDLPHCREVKPLYIGSDLSKVSELMKYANEQQWEGLMLNLDMPYVCKRSDYILKVKVFNEADVRVLNVLEGTGKNVGKLGSITIQFQHKGQLYECNCGSGFSDEERNLYWVNPELLINKIVTISYFEISKNSDGSFSLRFPTWESIIRDDKDEISMY